MILITKTALVAGTWFLALGTALAQVGGTSPAVDESAASAAKSAASAAGSAAGAASSASAAKKAADSVEAKFSLPVSIAAGDRIKLRSNVAAMEGKNGAANANAPLNTCLRVTRLDSGNGITVTVEEGDRIFGSCATPNGAPGVVVTGNTYKLSSEQLKDASYSRYGWIYGPMAVPFKFFPHDRSFEPSQSLGMYLGYRTSWFESRGLSWVASAGLATMKVSQVVDDPAKPGAKTTKENTVAGYTVAGGVLFDLTRETKPFVAGLLMGRDFVGSNSALTYRHDNRTWIALQIGWVL